MSWTQGQHNRGNQSPFIDPVTEDRQPKSTAGGYSKPNPQRGDYNSRNNNNSTPTPRAPMRDVAATFTQEGLQTFATIFSSTVEAALAKELPDIVERVVNRKLEDVMQQLQGMWQQFAEDLVSRIQETSQAANHTVEAADEIIVPVAADDVLPETVQTVAAQSVAAPSPEAQAVAASPSAAPSVVASNSETLTAIESEKVDSLASEPANEDTFTEPRPLVEDEVEVEVAAQAFAQESADIVNEADVKEADEEVLVDEMASEPRSGGRNTAKWPEEVEAVKQALRTAGRPVKADELRRMVPNIHWGNQPAIKMSTLVNKSKGQIQRVGRGIYQAAEMAE